MSSALFPAALLKAYEDMQHRGAIATATRACLSFYEAGQPGGLVILEGCVLAALHEEDAANDRAFERRLTEMLAARWRSPAERTGAPSPHEAPGELAAEAERLLRDLAAQLANQHRAVFNTPEEGAAVEDRILLRARRICYETVRAYATDLVAAHEGSLVKSAAFGGR